ncbi:MAG: type II toxin-antitoxin system VapC family toxin [Promethearchaeota archaeon]
MDSNILVYALLENHPAHLDCVDYLTRLEDDEFLSTTETLYEIYRVLTVFYGLTPGVVVEKIQQLLHSRIQFHDIGCAFIDQCLT